MKDLIQNLSSRFIVKDVRDKANTCDWLIKVDFQEVAQHKRPGDVNAGNTIKLQLNDLKRNGKFSDAQIITFKRDIVEFLSTLCALETFKKFIKVAVGENRSESLQFEMYSHSD